MPLTLQKLRSRTLPFSLAFMGETVEGLWAPARYSGEMMELAEELVAENEESDDVADALEVEAIELESKGDLQGAALKRRGARRLQQKKARRDMRHLRTLLSTVLVEWDLLDGEVPYPTDEANLRKLPDGFVTAVFLAISNENRPDPTKPPSSVEESSTAATSASSPSGTSSSKPPATSESLPGSSSPVSPPPATTQPGDAGPS